MQGVYLKGSLTCDNPTLFKPPPDHIPLAESVEAICCSRRRLRVRWSSARATRQTTLEIGMSQPLIGTLDRRISPLPQFLDPLSPHLLNVPPPTNSASYRFEEECWIWVSKRDMRALIPSLASIACIVFSWYVFLSFSYLTARIAPPCIYSFSFLLSSSFTSSLSYCSTHDYSLFSMALHWRCSAFISFSF